MSKYLYLLDNGHGEETKKKSSPVWKDLTQLHEYEFNRNVVKYLSYLLKDSDIDYEILVPELNDVSLSQRVKRANNLGNERDCIFISVHANQFTSEKVHGFETHYYSSNGMDVAETFQKHISTLGKNRGIKQSNFYVIKNTSMPAVLTENGFYSNESQCKEMMTPEFQHKVAEQHFNAIKHLETI